MASANSSIEKTRHDGATCVPNLDASDMIPEMKTKTHESSIQYTTLVCYNELSTTD